MSEFAQYKVISSKLKKRFLTRKPNYAEASEQFIQLSRDLQDFKPYSGYCTLAASKCEQNLGNTLIEFNLLLEAARQFRDGDELIAAVSAYRQAIKICDQALLNTVFAELAQMYEKSGMYVEAANAYQDAELYADAANCLILAKKYNFALSCFQKLPEDTLSHEYSVTIYLLKLCCSDPRRCDAQFPVICCNSENDGIVTLNILLESLLLLMQDKEDDVKVKGYLMAEMFPLLNETQKNLLTFILEERM
ncbi:hypothetical protein HDE_06333 [Halotydeus destructor]|nr:hypothetical protein HDE_06333 [Halotydeus destructor]